MVQAIQTEATYLALLPFCRRSRNPAQRALSFTAGWTPEYRQTSPSRRT